MEQGVGVFAGLPEQPESRQQWALTVCLKPTAVCCGALRSVLVMVLRASEYSSWMALIRPAGV